MQDSARSPMGGLRKGGPQPQSLVVHSQSRVLEIAFNDGASFRIPFELLRICSPSAEVQGHGPGQETLQTGKRAVEIVQLSPVGNYAVQPEFSDGHNTGIYSWEYLYFLGKEEAKLWADYAHKLQQAGRDRDEPMPSATGTACASH